MPEVISGSKLPDMAGEKLNQTSVEGARTRLRLWHFLLGTIRTFIPLSETDYNGNCQYQYSWSCHYTMVFANFTGYTRWMCKTSGTVKFPCFLDYYGNIQRNTTCPEHFTALVSQELKDMQCPRSHGLQTEKSMMQASQGKRGWRIQRKQDPLNPQDQWTKELTETEAASTGPACTGTRWVPSAERSWHRLPSANQKLSPTDNHLQIKFSFLQESLKG